MLLLDCLPQSDLFQITSPTKVIEPANSNSISPINIPLISSEAILAVSPNSMLVNEYTRKRKRLVSIDHNLRKFSTHSPIIDLILDAVWYQLEQKFLLLTTEQIFSYDPENQMIESISDIYSDEGKSFKSLTIDNNQSSLFIAYDEWGSKCLDQWKQDGQWKRIGRHILNLNSNEFIGIILAINNLKIAMTIYNNLTEEWRMEIRDIEMSICLKRILLPGKDPEYDYRMIMMEKNQSDIQWLIYSQDNNQILALDSKWQMRYLNYHSPIYRMAQFREKNLIVRTRKRIDIHLFI